jgi:hypothetical protein
METIKNYFKFYYHLGTSSGRIISENTSKLISNIRQSRLKLTMKKLNYKDLQIKLLFKWAHITIFLWIVNMFLYNRALCNGIPDSVTEWVQKYEVVERDPIQEEADRLGIWGLVSRRFHDQDIGVWLEDHPHKVPQVNIEPLVDGNTTCENSVANESIVPSQEEEFEAKISYITMVMDHAIAILNTAYPNSNPDDIPDISIKNAAYTALINHGNVSEWTAKTESDVVNDRHASNVYIAIIQSVIDNSEEMTPIETTLLCHLATSMTLVNSASALNIDKTQLEVLFNNEFYDQMLAKFTAK